MQKDPAEWQSALADCDRAIALDPGNFPAHFQRGNVLRMLGRPAEAIAAYDRAIALSPAAPEPWFNRGVVLQRSGQLPAALDSYERAVALSPGLFQALFNRGNVLRDLGRPEAALASYDAALALRADYPEALSHRGAVLQALGRWDEALASYDRALALRPDYAEGYFNRGTLHRELTQWADALADYDRALAHNPQFTEALYAKSLVRLVLGDYAGGWPLYESRWAHAARLGRDESRSFAAPRWTGAEDLAGRRVLLWCEQGLGDTLQFCRYAQLVAARGAHVILEVQVPLVELLRGLDGVAELLPQGEPLPPFDLQCPLLSLPLAFGTTLDTVPARVAYLSADAGKAQFWRRQLGPRARPRIGLVWSGNKSYSKDAERSVRLAEWLSSLPRHYDYFCLQRDIREADRRTLEDNPWVRTCADEYAGFSYTAALIGEMDLVLSVDTSIAHLSAALGQRTWLLEANNPDWRWLLDREDSPWYPTLRLFRQPARGDWRSVFARIAADLPQEMAAAEADSVVRPPTPAQ